MALNNWGGNHLVIQHNRKGAADVFSGVVAKFTSARRVKPEGHRRAVVLIKAWLRIHQLFAGDNGGCFHGVEHALFVKGWQDFVAHTGWCVRIRGAAHNRIERQLCGGADDFFQLRRRANARHLNEDTIRALTLDGGLTCAHFVDTAADDFQRLLHCAFVRREFLRI